MTPDWLRDSVAQGSPLPCADYAALPDLKKEDEKRPSSSKSESRFSSSLHGSPSTRPQSPPRAAHTDVTPPAFLLPPPIPPSAVELDHTAHLCCSRASPLVCVNQPLCAALDVLRRSRALESNERSALSYARAIAVSFLRQSSTLFSLTLTCMRSTGYQRCPRMHLVLSAHPLTGSSAFPRKITAKERGEVQKLPFIGAKTSKMVGGLRTTECTIHSFYSHWARSTNTFSMVISPKLVRTALFLSTFNNVIQMGNRGNETVGTLQSSVVIHHRLWHRTDHGANSIWPRSAFFARSRGLL